MDSLYFDILGTSYLGHAVAQFAGALCYRLFLDSLDLLPYRQCRTSSY
jgi:hypothetical protein